jgi:hypothetical protein
MYVATIETTVSSDWLIAHGETADPNMGTCEPVSDNKYDGTCSRAEYVVGVTDTATSVEVRWTDFTGGSAASVDPATITGFGFYFTWGGDTDSAYDIDITLDDFGFIE